MSWKDVLKTLIGKQSTDSADIPDSSKSSAHTTRPQIYSGIETQFNGITSDKSHKQLVIGLDFGTAFTKAVVGEERLRFAIPLNGTGKDINDYLLPSRFWLDAEGVCSIDNQTGRQHTDLKMGLIEERAKEENLVKVSAYLSLVFRRIRAFVFNHKEGIYGKNYIDWLVNVGLPTDSYHSESLLPLYHKIISSAWVASASDANITLDTVLQIDEHPDKSDTHSLHHEAISVFPEFVAQVTGYVRSPLRQSDLHLLIDIGAGTLDSTVFNVHEQDNEDRFPIFAKAVKPLGTRYLVKHRLKESSIGETGELDPFSPIPKKRRFAEILNIREKDLDTKDQMFRSKVIQTIGGMLTYTMKKRYPRSRRWKSGVPVFLCGGGANCDFYRDAFISHGAIGGISITEIKLPKPDSLEAEGIGTLDYDRISVAYGLSFDPFDIGEIIKADQIEDITEDPKRSDSVKRVEGNTYSTCSKCHGTGGLYMHCNRCGGRGYVT